MRVIKVIEINEIIAYTKLIYQIFWRMKTLGLYGIHQVLKRIGNLWYKSAIRKTQVHLPGPAPRFTYHAETVIGATVLGIPLGCLPLFRADLDMPMSVVTVALARSAAGIASSMTR